MWRREVINVLIQIDLDIVLKNKRHLYDEETWDRMKHAASLEIKFKIILAIVSSWIANNFIVITVFVIYGLLITKAF